MASAPQNGGGQGGGGKRAALIAVNDLNYVLPPDMSVSVNRTHTNHYFQQSKFSNNQRAICSLNSGANYLDMRQSSLEFGVKLTTGAATTVGWFGKNGSALNLISSITVSSRSGDELVRINQSDLLHYMTTGFRATTNWVETVGQTMGYGSTVLNAGHNTVETRFSIPLYCLTELFGYGRLLPPMLASGMRISITWTDPSVAFVSKLDGGGAGGTITAYEIQNPYISTYAHQLSDGVQRDLNELSATNGLEIVYCDWEPTEANYPSATKATVQLEIRKAASRALKAFAVTRDTTHLNAISEDSYASAPWDYRRWQWQLGSLYFPQQPVVSADSGATVDTQTVSAIPESYKHALISFGTYKGGNQPCSAIPFRQTNNFLNYVDAAAANTGVTDTPWEQAAVAGVGIAASKNGQWGTYANGMSVVGCLLERTDLFNLSGVPINNSRVLSFRADFDKTAAAVRTVTVFLKYVRLARVFLNNVEVEQ